MVAFGMHRNCGRGRRFARSAGCAGRVAARLLALLVLAGILLLGLLARRRMSRDAAEVAAAVIEATTRSEPADVTNTEPSGDAGAPAVAPAAPLEPEDQARKLVEELVALKLTRPDAADKGVTEFRLLLQELLSLDTAALPALAEYFQRSDTVRYESEAGTNPLGDATLRLALLQLLPDISAPDNEEFQARLLPLVADPDEVVLLARQLQIAAPGEHREALLEAARASLAMTREGRFPGRDIGPVLKLIERLEAAAPDPGR